MLYVVKFLYSFILPPGLFVILLLLMAIWLWKIHTTAACVLLGLNVLLYLSMIPLVADTLIGSLEHTYPQPKQATVQSSGDVIVVLGGGATSGTPDVNGTGNLSGAAGNRLITAMRLYRETGLPIIFSGGQVFSDSGNEADIARRQLIAMGVPEQDVIAENASLNTEQNAANTSELLKQHHWSKPVLITSAMHMERSVIEFERAGWKKVLPYPTDYWTSTPRTLYVSKFAPSGSSMNAFSSACKEYLGIAVAKFRW